MERSNSLAVRIVSCAVAAILAICIATDALAYSAAAVVKLNSPPVAENITLETYRGIPVSHDFASLDPDGDDVAYSVSVPPKKGDVDIDGDTFTYTPRDGKRGKDTFRYVAVDALGNVSADATVTVNIKKQRTKVTYADLSGTDCLYDATLLAESGVFIGEKIGENYFFSPDAPVNRGEFLVMCMELCGIEPTAGITRTGFFDDGEIPMWQKPYVAAALMGDVISGYKDDYGNIVFSSGDTITAAEASVIMNNVLDITDVTVSLRDEQECPVWASQAVANLGSCGIENAAAGVFDAPLTRSMASRMLSDAARFISGR